ncbi:MAG TPA: MAPEG family protein [Gammaproteobacteria bacterium]|nr:MAPEG family protein [Gammaproteobacteria bacterium]
MLTTSLVPPVLALIGWTFVMWVWLYATRIPALRAARVDLVAVSSTGAKLDLPPEVARVADNYNHLHEQPTIFYALALAAEHGAAVDGISVALAWAYVALRVIHSFVQATRNVIIVRFYVFATASVVLFLLLLRTIVLLVP